MEHAALLVTLIRSHDFDDDDLAAALIRHDPRLVSARVPLYGFLGDRIKGDTIGTLAVDQIRPETLLAYLANGGDPRALIHRVMATWETGPCMMMLRALLEHGGDPNARDRYGRTPLYVAVDNHVPVGALALLRAHGADLDIRDRYGVSAIAVAANRGWLDALAWLLDHGVSPFFDLPTNFNAPDWAALALLNAAAPPFQVRVLVEALVPRLAPSRALSQLVTRGEGIVPRVLDFL